MEVLHSLDTKAPDCGWAEDRMTGPAVIHGIHRPNICILFFILSYLIRGSQRWKAMMLAELLSLYYPWIKALHVISVIAWMAGLFYLPRLFVYHAEVVEPGSATDILFQTMERRLLRAIMNPAMTATWLFGLALVFTPGIVYWGDAWPWAKAAAVVGMTWFHHWLARRRKDFAIGRNTRTGRRFRMMNEVPTVLLIVIVVSVIVKY